MCILRKHRHITKIEYNFKHDLKRLFILRHQLAKGYRFLRIGQSSSQITRVETRTRLYKKTIIALFYLVVHSCFQLVGIAIEDTIAITSSKANSEKQDWKVQCTLNKLQAIHPYLIQYENINITFSFHSLLKLFCAFNFRCVSPVMNIFCQIYPKLRYL